MGVTLNHFGALAYMCVCVCDCVAGMGIVLQQLMGTGVHFVNSMTARLDTTSMCSVYRQYTGKFHHRQEDKNVEMFDASRLLPPHFVHTYVRSLHHVFATHCRL